MPNREINPALAVQALDERVVAGVLNDAAIQPGRAILADHLDEIERIFKPLDSAVVSVCTPIVFNHEDVMADLRFRFAHDVLASSDRVGTATFGRGYYEDDQTLYDPPLADAVTEMSFYPPRRNARYLLEFWCWGEDPIAVQGSDNTDLQQRSNGSISFVHYSARTSVSYTLSSTNYWWFKRSKISWLPN